jgi:hypothetical protein
MFNLEQSIADWRRQMLAAGIKTPVPLEELEIHLREEIERQMKSELNEQKAFEVAVRKIGSARTVQNEFMKVEETEEQRKWKEGQIWLGAIMGVFQLIVIGAILFNSEMTFGQRMSGLAAIATSFLLVGAGRWSCRIFPIFPVRRTRVAINFILGCVPAIIWSGAYAVFVLPGHEFAFGEWLAAILWASCPPLGLSFGLIWGIETVARKKILTSD